MTDDRSGNGETTDQPPVPFPHVSRPLATGHAHLASE